jgi:hypothetical protein
MACSGGTGTKRKPPAHAPESGSHEPGQKAGRSGLGRYLDGGTGKTTTGSPRPTASAREAQEPDPKPEKHAEDEAEGTRPAGQGEETNPTKPHPAPDAATASRRAFDREASRRAMGTEGPPPAHQVTEAPAANAPATPEAEETDEDAPGAQTRTAGQGGQTGPKAAKTRSRQDAPRASAEETTRASPPMAHPTATPRRGNPAKTEPTTPETNAETPAEAGREREPQKPTIPATKITPTGNAYDSKAASRRSEE